MMWGYAMELVPPSRTAMSGGTREPHRAAIAPLSRTAINGGIAQAADGASIHSGNYGWMRESADPA
jgi:hypothetical protein